MCTRDDLQSVGESWEWFEHLDYSRSISLTLYQSLDYMECSVNIESIVRAEELGIVNIERIGCMYERNIWVVLGNARPIE